MENGQKSAEWEAQVFNRSRTREEYVKLVATLIWKLRDYNKKVYFIFLVISWKPKSKNFCGQMEKSLVQWSLGIVFSYLTSPVRHQGQILWSVFLTHQFVSQFSQESDQIFKNDLCIAFSLSSHISENYRLFVTMTKSSFPMYVPYTLENCMDRIWRWRHRSLPGKANNFLRFANSGRIEYKSSLLNIWSDSFRKLTHKLMIAAQKSSRKSSHDFCVIFLCYIIDPFWTLLSNL